MRAERIVGDWKALVLIASITLIVISLLIPAIQAACKSPAVYRRDRYFTLPRAQQSIWNNVTAGGSLASLSEPAGRANRRR